MSSDDRPVYLVAHLVAKDPDAYVSRYAIEVIGQLEAVGAEVLAADPPVMVEGNPAINRTVVVRFPNRAVAMQWYESEAYAPFRQLRISELVSECTAGFVGEFDPGAAG